MDPQETDRLQKVRTSLEARGIETHGLAAIQEEREVMRKPPGLFGRLGTSLRNNARTQWELVKDEGRETGELVRLLNQRVRDGTPLDPVEKDKVRAQLLDLFKAVPAGAFAAANAVLPIPGTSMFTPMLLQRMGLMPSRWREAHILNQLRAEAKRFREEGLEEEAAQLDAVGDEICTEADWREQVESSALLLSKWDANENG
ncbi:MAG: hypothetical protein QGG40_03870, partial [Myxococcota bacterium]|nr:hypothetical protein [Myxococcota bacterium]